MNSILEKVNLQAIPKGYRLWIHVAERKPSAEEYEYINQEITAFVNSWQSHGASLTANHWWIMNRVLLIGVNESKGSVGGCSLDSKTHFIQTLEGQVKLKLGDNSKFYAIVDGEICSYSRKEFKKALTEGNLNEDTVVLNTLCPSTDRIETDLLPQIKNSWHKTLMG